MSFITALQDSVNSVTGTASELYSPDPKNWYRALPYTFIYTQPGPGGEVKEFPLPINPSNINVVTHFATNVISTIYGTVEEHTDVRYFDIVIEGTTGFAPRYTSASAGSIGSATNLLSSAESTAGKILGKATNLLTGKSVGGPTIGRSSFQVTGPALGGLFSKTISSATNFTNSIADIFGGSGNPSGIDDDLSGYMAFHNLYKFLLAYKKGVSQPGLSLASFGFSFGFLEAGSSQHPLQFINYKDGIAYNVAIRNFVLKRSAENPMLYFYSISMRGYDIGSPDETFKGDSDKAILAGLGLDGVQSSSILGTMKKIAGKARSAAGSLIGGINTFGR